MKKRILLIATAALTLCGYMSAQDNNSILDNLNYDINAGFSLGGAAPIPLPAEIRKIESYNPDMNLSLGVRGSYFFEDHWGLTFALRFDTKGMTTGASVKDYGMEIIQEDSRVKGRWTGKVSTTYHSSQLVFPLSVIYKINPSWSVDLGPYLAIALKNDFYGHVYDGYLREGDPTGEKVVFSGDSKANYEFSDELRTLQYGLELGASWRATKHLRINGRLSWGLNDIFKSSFKTISFTMYPIYLNLGFGYEFGK